MSNSATIPSPPTRERRPMPRLGPPETASARRFAADSSTPVKLLRWARVIRRGLLIVAWTMPSIAVQFLLLRLPGDAKERFPMLFWSVVSRIMGIRVRVVGTLPTATGGRPVLFVSNHTSWVDIPIVGGVLNGCFVAKGEVGTWPLIGTIARAGRTVFVSRQRATTGQERDEMRARLDDGSNLILFPEGTSSDGSRTLPFRSSFLAIAEPRLATDPSRVPIIQPVSVVYDRLGGMPIGRASRVVFSWYGDMDIGSHFWALGQRVGMRVTVVLHPTIDPRDLPDRKALTRTVWDVVAGAAAELRQNRPVG
jgi:1-acyl-sn-glycerol-3-phosphate acyltransferase